MKIRARWYLGPSFGSWREWLFHFANLRIRVDLIPMRLVGLTVCGLMVSAEWKDRNPDIWEPRLGSAGPPA
jgi:hypothetical protein